MGSLVDRGECESERLCVILSGGIPFQFEYGLRGQLQTGPVSLLPKYFWLLSLSAQLTAASRSVPVMSPQARQGMLFRHIFG